MTMRTTLATMVLAALPMAAASRCEEMANAGASAAGPVCAPVSKEVRRDLGLTVEQAANARAVLQVADEMKYNDAIGLPERAKVIAIATTLQESNLRTDAVGDGGRAVGIFQQHRHWAPRHRDDRKDAEASARRFYAQLVKVPRWHSRPLTVAAQKVQRSADGSLYAKHEARATRIVTKLTTCKGAS